MLWGEILNCKPSWTSVFSRPYRSLVIASTIASSITEVNVTFCHSYISLSVTGTGAGSSSKERKANRLRVKGLVDERQIDKLVFN